MTLILFLLFFTSQPSSFIQVTLPMGNVAMLLVENSNDAMKITVQQVAQILLA